MTAEQFEPATTRPPELPSSPAVVTPAAPDQQKKGYDVPVRGTEPPFKLMPGEKIWREYHLADSARPLGAVGAKLYVSDARILYRADAANVLGKSSAQQEVQLKSVTGVTLNYERGATPETMVAVMLVALMSYFFLHWAVSVLALAIGALIAWHRRDATIEINTAQASPGLSITGSKVPGVLRSVVRGFLRALAYPVVVFAGLFGVKFASSISSLIDRDVMMRVYEEITSVVTELQTRGTLD